MTEAQATRRIRRMFGASGVATLRASGDFRVGQISSGGYFLLVGNGLTWEEAFTDLERRLASYVTEYAAAAARPARILSRYYGGTRATRRAYAIAAAKLTRIQLPAQPREAGND